MPSHLFTLHWNSHWEQFGFSILPKDILTCSQSRGSTTDLPIIGQNAHYCHSCYIILSFYCYYFCRVLLCCVSEVYLLGLS